MGAGAKGGAEGCGFGQGQGKGEKARVAEKKSPAGRKVMDHAGRRHESCRFSECYSIPADWLSPAVSARTDAAPGIKASAAPHAGEKRPHSAFQRGGGGEGWSQRPGDTHPPPIFTFIGALRASGWEGGHSYRPLPKPELARKQPSQPPPLRYEIGNAGRSVPGEPSGLAFWVSPLPSCH